MTYLQIVNKILKKMRASTVSSVLENEESAVVSELVNEAKEWAEDAHNWTHLRTTIQVNTTATEFSYSLTGAGQRSNIIQVVNDTTDYEFGRASPYKRMNTLLTGNNVETQEPREWDLNGQDGDKDPVVNFYPVPDAVYAINFNIIVPQDDLVNDTDELSIPPNPVVLYAYAMAVEERGEEGGASVNILFQRAQAALDRAVSIDSVTLQDEFTWEIE